MTTVSYSRDKTYNIIAPDGGVVQVGNIESRNTSGGDRTLAERQAGLFLDHAYSGTRSSNWLGYSLYESYSGNVLTYRTWQGKNGNTVLNVAPYTWTSNDDIKLLGRLAEKIRLHDWNVGIFVGELGKTVDTVCTRAKQIGRAVLAVKGGRFIDAVKILGAKPDVRAINRAYYYRRSKGTTTKGRTIPGDYATWYGSWLELRYAWRPLLNDIYELSEAIRTWDSPRSVVLKASYKVKQAPSASIVGAVAGGSGATAGYIKATLKENPQSLTSHLGLNNPESVVWELVPFSFVADWFIPIGNYLQARNTLSKTTGVYVRTQYVWKRLHLASYYDLQGNPAGVHVIRSGVYGNVAISSMSISRSLLSSISVPLPSFKNPAGTSDPGKRLLDAIALVTAAVYGGVNARAIR